MCYHSSDSTLIIYVQSILKVRFLTKLIVRPEVGNKKNYCVSFNLKRQILDRPPPLKKIFKYFVLLVYGK